MADPFEVVSVLVAFEFVVLSAVLLLLAPLDVVAPALPLCLVFLIALHRYVA